MTGHRRDGAFSARKLHAFTPRPRAVHAALALLLAGLLALGSLAIQPTTHVTAQEDAGTPIAGDSFTSADQTGDDPSTTTEGDDTTPPTTDGGTTSSTTQEAGGDASPPTGDDPTGDSESGSQSETEQPPAPVSAFEVTEGKADAGLPGAQTHYRHNLTNTGDPARFSIVPVSAAGWPVTLAYSDGTPLADTDSDGLLDLGLDPLATGQARVIDATITIPAEAVPDTQDTLTLTVLSSLDPAPAVPTAIIDTTKVLAPPPTTSRTQTTSSLQSVDQTAGVESTSDSRIASVTPETQSQNAEPGAALCFEHTVNQIGTANNETFTLTVQGPQDWSVGVYKDASCTTQFSPAEVTFKVTGNNPFTPVTFYVQVQVPADAADGSYDTTVTAAPVKGGTSDSATDTIVVSTPVPLTLSIESNPQVNFGAVAPTGETSGIDGITSTADDQGADYFYNGIAKIKITAPTDLAWTVSCSATENGGSAATISIQNGRLQWQDTSTTGNAWTAFTTEPVANQPCAAGTGSAEITFNYRLRVNWSDSPGDFSTTVTYELTSN